MNFKLTSSVVALFLGIAPATALGDDALRSWRETAPKKAIVTFVQKVTREGTTAGPRPRFALIMHHTDGEREWAYDRTSHIGKLDQALDEAMAKGWAVVSMKDDGATIFPTAK